MKIVKKIINIFIDILVVLILLISASILTITLTTDKDTGVSDIFGYTLNTIQSQSMEPEMYKGDLLIGKVTDTNTEYKKGDIVFYHTIETDDNGESFHVIVCHRIVDIEDTDGVKKYLTKGDNNEVTDEETVGWLNANDIVGIYQNDDYSGVNLSGWGNVLDYLQSFWGFFFVIVLPMILFFIYELIRVIINLTAYNKEKALVAAQEMAANAELTEQQKQKAIEEYLASQQAKADADSDDVNKSE